MKRKIIEIDEEKCTGCGQCATACAEGAIEIVGGKAKVVNDVFCDGLGACIGECPEDALHIIEREAPEFDPEAVEKRLAALGHAPHEAPASPPKAPAFLRAAPEGKHMCPSAAIRNLAQACEDANRPAAVAGVTLGNWPIQIRLVPPHAPFLKGADLLVAADCAPAACPGFHRDYLPGKVLLLGCPKFDNAQEYVEKFAAIFREAGVKSVTVLDMEVPCCSALPVIVKKGMALAGKNIPVEEVVVSVRGRELEKRAV